LKQFVPEQVYKKIEKSPIALEPTFHEVSILFSDIRGFTRMSQEIRPEKLAAFLNNDYFTPMGEIAYKHDGMVDKHIGDSIMVVLRLKIGIGIATGSAFSGILGSLRIKEFTSIGMPVNIAARLEGMAKAEEILICDTTFQKLAGKIDAKPLPPVAVKGLDGPITVYRVKY